MNNKINFGSLKEMKKLIKETFVIVSNGFTAVKVNIKDFFSQATELGLIPDFTVTAPSVFADFDKLTPTTSGVTFSPNIPSTEDVLYTSTIDYSLWVYRSGGYHTYTGVATVKTSTTEQVFINALTVSPAPLDTMMIQVTDPASTTIKKFSWANLKTYLFVYFDQYFPRKTVASTGSVISFEAPVVWNTFGTPSTANLTDDLTNAKIGYIQKIYHNKAVEPTYPAGWVKMGTGTYTNGVLNVIFAEWVSGTRVEYWIVKPA